VAKPRLHLDSDTSNADLEKALLKRGHDVTCTPNEWMALDASDEEQLLGATAQGRSIFTFNAKDFLPLAKKYPRHAGIILSQQKALSRLIKALDRFFKGTKAEELEGQVRWLSDWEK
jgi:hypothetical protein